MDTSLKTKPFKTYNGGKESDGTYQKIINIMPPHLEYIEPFIGNGAVFRHKKRALFNIVSDIDECVTEKWTELLDYESVVLVKNMSVFELLKELKEQKTKIKYPLKTTLIYLDPPYPLETRRNKKKLYKHEFTRKDHIRILQDARSLKFYYMIIISSYPNDLYNEALKDWNSFEFESSTRSGMRTEKVWFNYDYPTELHDYRYLGDNFRERERIKNTVQNTVSKINRMPPAVRNYVINELKNCNNDNL